MIDLLAINLHLQRVRMKGPGSQFTKPLIASFGRLYGTLDAFRVANSKLCWGDLNICPSELSRCLKKVTT